MPVSRLVRSGEAVPTPTPTPVEPATDPGALTAAELAAALGSDTATATRLLAVATALVNRYAPDAPVAIANEAVIRCAGWLYEAPSSGARMESIGDVRTSFSPGATGALRSSGAMALLSPWKIRRAGVLA